MTLLGVVVEAIILVGATVAAVIAVVVTARVRITLLTMKHMVTSTCRVVPLLVRPPMIHLTHPVTIHAHFNY